MLPDVFLCESHCCGIVVKTPHYLEFANVVFPSSTYVPLRHWSYVEPLESHVGFLTFKLVIARPLPSLHEIGHFSLNYIVLSSRVEIMGCNQSQPDQISYPR
jgi:hypothetical protein